MMWTIEVDSKCSRVQWNRLDIRLHSDLEAYLKYLGIQGYTGPGEYQMCDGLYARVSYKELA